MYKLAMENLTSRRKIDLLTKIIMTLEENNTTTNQESLATLIEELNTQLLEESAALAARAFNLGCVLSGLVVGIVVTITWLLTHWLTAFVALVMTVLVAVGVSSLLAMRVRYNNMVRIYQDSIVPEIQAAIYEHNVDVDEWSSLVNETLPDDASLKLMLDKFPLEGNSHEQKKTFR